MCVCVCVCMCVCVHVHVCVRVCVRVGKELDLEELSGGAEGWRGPEDGLRELFNRPLKQGLLTLLTTLLRASPSSLSTRGTAYAHTRQLRAISH